MKVQVFLRKIVKWASGVIGTVSLFILIGFAIEMIRIASKPVILTDGAWWQRLGLCFAGMLAGALVAGQWLTIFGRLSEKDAAT